jgi:hypothetical protein
VLQRGRCSTIYICGCYEVLMYSKTHGTGLTTCIFEEQDCNMVECLKTCT